MSDTPARTIHDFTAVDIDGQPLAMDGFRGKVLLIVNVASQCGFTPQYTGLETLWRDYGGILGIDAIKWNFTKFLVGRDGKVIRRYAPKDAPASIAGDIETALR